MTKKTSLIILGITSLLFSRTVFFFFEDPEGPNLLVVTVAAAIIFGASLVAFTFGAQANSSKRFWVALVTQVVVGTILYILGITF